MNSSFDYEGALAAGYTPEEIDSYLFQKGDTKKPFYESPTKDDSAWTKIGKNFRNFFGNLGNPVEENQEASITPKQLNERLLKKSPNFDVQGALQAGYSPDEINDYLHDNQTKRSFMEKSGRIGAQYGLGLLQSHPASMAYDIATMPLASKTAMNVPYREDLGNELEYLMEKKAYGEWTTEDEKFLEHIKKQILDPRKSKEFVKTGDVGIRDIVEEVTGIDFHPEGALEKAAHWMGFIRNPKNVKDLVKLGTTPKNIQNSIFPGSKDVLRGLTAGTALEMAEDNHFGPLGTLGAAIVGDLIGVGTAGIGKAILNPKKTLAKGMALISNSKNAIKNDLKEAISETPFTKDLGTLTNNNVIQMIQARLSASGLTGKPLEELRKKMTKEIVQEYESIAKELGEARFTTLHEAGEVAKEGIKKIRDADKEIYQELYSFADKTLKKDAQANVNKLVSSVRFFRENLTPGTLKSTEQNAVLNFLDKIESDIHEVGNEFKSNVKDLMNTKIALNDIINYEVQGGAKQLLKKLVSDTDRAIISHGKENPAFARNYIAANKKFSDHAKTFRKRNIDQLLRLENPEQLMNRMNNVQGIRDLKNVLDRTHEGKQIFRGLSRNKLDRMIGDNMKDGITEQIKFGKLSNLIKDSQNRALLKEIVSPDAYKRILNLQKHAGELAETAQKFFNASQSATAGADLAMTGAMLTGVFSFITGNPWSLSAIGGFAIAKQAGKLMADTEFLKLTEQAIRAARKNNISSMNKVSENMIDYISEIMNPNLLITKKSQEE